MLTLQLILEQFFAIYLQMTEAHIYAVHFVCVNKMVAERRWRSGVKPCSHITFTSVFASNVKWGLWQRVMVFVFALKFIVLHFEKRHCKDNRSSVVIFTTKIIRIHLIKELICIDENWPRRHEIKVFSFAGEWTDLNEIDSVWVPGTMQHL